MSDLPPPDPDEVVVDPARGNDYLLDGQMKTERVGLTGVDEMIVDPPEDHVNYAPDPPSTIGEGYPIGVHVGAVGTVWIGEHEYVVDPDTGCITGQA